jgi:cytochrome c-type biogenesis protein CcmH
LLFWFLTALLTAAAIMAVLIPLGRSPLAGDPSGHFRRVYLDQLAELARDKALGRIGEKEAEATRAEIGRRLIAADATPAVTADGTPTARRVTALVALFGIPLLSLSLYLGLGAPNLPGAPLAARLDRSGAADDVEVLVAKVEARLAEQPEEGRGWDVIAPIYLRLGRAEDSARAYRNAIRLLGSTAEREGGLGEAILASEGGIVTADARTAFEAANRLDPAAPLPRFFLALASEQEGDFAGAAERLRTLLAEAPPDAPWRDVVAEALARVEPLIGGPGSDKDAVAALQALPAVKQTAAIEGMVSGLAERLANEPDDAEGWKRLIRSYVVLGRMDAAGEAARAGLAGVEDAAGRAEVEALIAELGVTPAGALAQ